MGLGRKVGPGQNYESLPFTRLPCNPAFTCSIRNFPVIPLLQGTSPGWKLKMNKNWISTLYWPRLSFRGTKLLRRRFSERDPRNAIENSKLAFHMEISKPSEASFGWKVGIIRIVTFLRKILEPVVHVFLPRTAGSQMAFAWVDGWLIDFANASDKHYCALHLSVTENLMKTRARLVNNSLLTSSYRRETTSYYTELVKQKQQFSSVVSSGRRRTDNNNCSR